MVIIHTEHISEQHLQRVNISKDKTEIEYTFKKPPLADLFITSILVTKLNIVITYNKSKSYILYRSNNNGHSLILSALEKMEINVELPIRV